MIKFFLLITIFLSCGILGVNVSKLFNEKHLFYNELLDFCTNLKNQISFLKTDIITIMDGTKCKSKLTNILSDIKRLIEKDIIIDKTKLLDILNKYNFLNEADKNVIVSLFCDIGTMGYDEQLAIIEHCICNIGKSIDDYKQSKLKYVGLSKKMGFLVGLIICVVLI